jgi:integrase
MTIGSFPQMSVGEAKERAALLAREVVEGKDPAALEKYFKISYSFRELCEDFIAKHVEIKCSKKTAKEYRRLIYKELITIWGERDIRCISSADIQQSLALLTAQKNAAVLANRSRSLLHRIFRYAIEQGLLTSNPVKETKRQNHTPKQQQILENDEISRLWSASGTQATDQADAFRFLLLSGQTLGILRELKWSNIRLEQLLVEKRNLKRELYLSPPLMEILRRQRDRGSNSEYVFGPQSYSDLGRYAKRIAKSAQISSDFSLSWIRRTMLYRLPTQGVSHPATDYILGRITSLNSYRIEIERAKLEARRAMQLWTRLVIPSKPKKSPPSSKVVPLFGE